MFFSSVAATRPSVFSTRVLSVNRLFHGCCLRSRKLKQATPEEKDEKLHAVVCNANKY